MTLARGLYDLVLTEAVARFLDAIAPDVADLREFDRAELADRLVESHRCQLHILDELHDTGDKAPAHELHEWPDVPTLRPSSHVGSLSCVRSSAHHWC